MDDLKNDIEKYLRGELPEGKMHALEKQALDDPFLAEALEGASGIDPHDFAQDTALLRQRLDARINSKKTIPLWVWPARIAAGLLLIAIATYLIIHLQESPQQHEAITYKAEEQTPEATGHPDTLQASQDNEYLSMNKAETEAAQPPQTAPRPSTPRTRTKPLPPPANAPETRQEAMREEGPEAEPLADVAEADGVATQAPPLASAPAKEEIKALPEPELAREKKRASPSSEVILADSTATASPVVVRGRVTGDDGSGLPGVNVIIKGSATGTVTDIHGNYQVALNNPRATLVYSFIGLESKEVPVNSKPVVDVSLNPDVAQLSEVVVVGYGEGKDEDEKSFATFDMAEPAGGRRAFKKYLEDKMIYPQEALANKIEGRVTIQFTVETSGQVSNFNVVKGLGYGCDDEVIRLIKEGPRWAPMKRDDEAVKGRVRVRMRFSLPKKK
jgi:TonB family protein